MQVTLNGYTYEKAHTKDNYAFLGNPNTPFYSTRNLPILLCVNHITVGATDLVGADTSIEATISWAKNASNTSWHGGVDSDSIHDTLPDSYTAWTQGLPGHSFNSPALSLEVGLHDVNWTKLPADHREATLRNMATWWAPRVVNHDIPIRYVFDRDKIDYMIARRQKIGFTDHKILNPANRRDPGWTSLTTNTFPFEHFLDLTEEFATIVRGGGSIPKPPPVPGVPQPTAPLVIDGRLGPATIKRWQWVMGTEQDGSISYPYSSLVHEVQEVLRAKGFKGKDGKPLVLDGKGILPNLSRDYGPTNTVWALQTALGMTNATGRDGVLSNPSSNAVKRLQANLNKATKGSRKFF